MTVLITYIVLALYIVVAILISIINKWSPIGMWFLVNQFQLLMLLLLTGTYMPKTVKQYLSSMNIVLFNLDFIPISRLPLISNLYDYMSFEQDNENMTDFGIDYGSTLVKNISFIFFMLLFIIAYLLVTLICT